MLQMTCRTTTSSPDELMVCCTLSNDRTDEVHETRTAEHPLPEMTTTTGMTLTVSLTVLQKRVELLRSMSKQ